MKVSLELVLAVDVSASVDRHEFQLQMQGISKAFFHPQVTSVIERMGGNGIAVAVILWSQHYNIKLAVPFTHVHDIGSAWTFGRLAAQVSRGKLAGYTALGGAMRHATRLLQENRFDGARRVIDISGDGRNNTRPSLGQHRRRAQTLGIVINGLAIESDDARLANYYLNNVITGAGSFVETAADYQDFAPAMLRKLVREITPPVTRHYPPEMYPVRQACLACIDGNNEGQILD